MDALIIFRSRAPLSKSPDIFKPGCYRVEAEAGITLDFDWLHHRVTISQDENQRTVFACQLFEFDWEFYWSNQDVVQDETFDLRALTSLPIREVGYECRYERSQTTIPLDVVSFALTHHDGELHTFDQRRM